MLSIGKKPDGSEKDTRRNIRERSHFVINIPHREQARAVTASSAGLAHGESEVEQLGLELTAFEGSALPRLADCRIALACERYQILDIGSIPQALILGRVNRIYADDTVLAESAPGERPQILAERVDPIGRLGGSDYTTFGEILTVPRPG
jgi:flavin reductase (DIM6/NTAB) family NADH-FMN oxidoreductase RutF